MGSILLWGEFLWVEDFYLGVNMGSDTILLKLFQMSVQTQV